MSFDDEYLWERQQANPLSGTFLMGDEIWEYTEGGGQRFVGPATVPVTQVDPYAGYMAQVDFQPWGEWSFDAEAVFQVEEHDSLRAESFDYDPGWNPWKGEFDFSDSLTGRGAVGVKDATVAVVTETGEILDLMKDMMPMVMMGMMMNMMSGMKTR